jgi:1,4-alpha-glucan branching enzyme
MTRLTNKGQVEFRFYRPNVREVRIAGEFTEWDRNPIPMHDDGDGWWSAVAKIDAGDHRFRYYADGQPFTDYAANGVEHSKQGWDSILTVPGSKFDKKDVQHNIKAKQVA